MNDTALSSGRHTALRRYPMPGCWYGVPGWGPLKPGQGKDAGGTRRPPSSSSAPPPPEELPPAERSPATTPSLYPFGLGNATAAYASAHVEPSGHHQCFTLDLDAMALTHTHTDSSEEDEVWARADFSRIHNPKAMRRFLAASNYCFGYSDSDDEGTYDPARECFHVGLEMPSMGDEDEGADNRVAEPSKL